MHLLVTTFWWPKLKSLMSFQMHSIPLLQGSTSDNVLTQHAYPCLREQVCSHLEPPVVLLNIYEFENVNGYLRSHCHGTQKCPASACSTIHMLPPTCVAFCWRLDFLLPAKVLPPWSFELQNQLWLPLMQIHYIIQRCKNCMIRQQCWMT